MDYQENVIGGDNVKEIEEVLENIITIRSQKEWKKEFRKEELLGRKIALSPSELVLVFLDVEKRFNIRIKEEDIISGNFNSYDNILKIVLREKGEIS